MSTRRNPPVYFVPLALLLGFSGTAQISQQSSACDSYELTAYAGFDGRLLVEDPTNGDFNGLKIHAFVKAAVPFSFVINNGHGDHLSISGTVRQIDTEDFCITNGKLEGFGMSGEGFFCNSKETREIRKVLEGILGPDSRYNPSDPPEAESTIWCMPSGPGYRLSIKRLLSPSQLTITSDGENVILAWPTNFTRFILESTTNFDSPVWTTNSLVPAIINGRNTITTRLSGTQQFFRLSW